MGDEKVVRIRVLAVADPSLKSAFQPFEEAAKRARQRATQALGTSPQDRARGGSYRAAAPHEEDAKAQEKAEAAKRREADKSAKYIQTVKYNSMLAEQRMEEKLGRERAARVQKEARERNAAMRDFGRSVGRNVASMGKAAIGTAGDIARGAGIDWSPQTLVQRFKDTEDAVIRATNSGFSAKGKVAQQSDIASASEAVSSAAMTSRRGRTEVATALENFVSKSSDIEMGKALLADLGKTANATGSDLQDLASAAGVLSSTMDDTPDKAQRVAAALRMMAKQGAMGTVEVKDLATLIPRLAAGANLFSGKYENNLADLGAISQQALKGGRSTAAEATNTAASLARDLTKKKTMEKWAAAGINIFEDQDKINPKDMKWDNEGVLKSAGKNTKLRSSQDLIVDVLDKTKGNQAMIAQLLPNQVSAAAVKSFLDVYNEGESSYFGLGSKMGGGARAVRKRFAELGGGMSQDDINKMSANYENSTTGRAQNLQNQLEGMFAGGFTKLMENPEQTLGTVGKAFADPTMLTGMLGATALGGMFGMGGGGPISQALQIAAASVVIEKVGELVIDKVRSDKDKQMTEAVSSRSSIQELKANAMVGKDANGENGAEAQKTFLTSTLDALKQKRADAANAVQADTSKRAKDAAINSLLAPIPGLPTLYSATTATDPGKREQDSNAVSEADAAIAAVQAKLDAALAKNASGPGETKLQNIGELASAIGKAVGGEINAKTTAPAVDPSARVP